MNVFICFLKKLSNLHYHETASHKLQLPKLSAIYTIQIGKAFSFSYKTRLYYTDKDSNLNLGTCKGNVNSVPVSKQRRCAIPWVFRGPHKGHQYAVLIPSLYVHKKKKRTIALAISHVQHSDPFIISHVMMQKQIQCDRHQQRLLKVIWKTHQKIEFKL